MYVLSAYNDKLQQNRGVSGLFIGVRASLLNAILPFGNWYLLGVPFLVKTRRMVSYLTSLNHHHVHNASFITLSSVLVLPNATGVCILLLEANAACTRRGDRAVAMH
jgi:hypothetical protein